jgi:hypothetical protein
MVQELAVAFLGAAAIVLVPVFVAGDLWARARNRGRLPSPPALATIAFGIATSLSNGALVFRVLAQGSAGVTGLTIVTALWATMALSAIWIALRTQRVRLYAARDTDSLLPVPPTEARVPPPRDIPGPAMPALVAPVGAAAGLIVYRDDPAPDQPCAAPLRARQLPPTIRDIVRAEAQRASALDATVAPHTDPAPHDDGNAAGSHAPVQAAHTLLPPELPPDALVFKVTPRARFPVRTMAETGRTAAVPEGLAFRSIRPWGHATTA